MKLLARIIAVADVAAVAYVEKVLMAGHTLPKELIVVGLVFALPIWVILLVAWLRGRAPSAPAPRSGGYLPRGGQ